MKGIYLRTCCTSSDERINPVAYLINMAIEDINDICIKVDHIVAYVYAEIKGQAFQVPLELS